MELATTTINSLSWRQNEKRRSKWKYMNEVKLSKRLEEVVREIPVGTTSS